jgi:hypothetical protein
MVAYDSEGAMAKKKMTYQDYCDEWGMTQVGMGRFLGISPRQSRRFAAGDPLWFYIELLLKLMHKQKLSPEEVYKRVEIKPPPEGFRDMRYKEDT